MKQSNLNSRHARGATMVYCLVALSTLTAFVSLGVDVARVQVLKTELQRAADSAARYAVTGISQGVGTTQTMAKDAANDNLADGTAVVLKNSDVEFGTWDSSAKTFSVLSGSARTGANAIRITAERTVARNNAIQLVWGKLIGQRYCDASCTSIALYTANSQFVTNLPATSNPFLAGMPNGTVANPVNPHNNPDYAPAANPVSISGLPIVPGSSLQFASIDGGANNDPNGSLYGPDGNTGWITGNIAGAEHGKSDLIAPINAVIAVFLDDSVPSSSNIPPTLDFSTQTARDFTSLSPQLRQMFFIGDGQTSGGVTQQFVVPPGATRLFLGTMDSYEWNNNIGSYTTTITMPRTIQLVK